MRATLWTHIQKGECRLEHHDPESIDFGIDGSRVFNRVDCNSQGGQWHADGNTFTTTWVMTTAMGCDEPRADLFDVRSWGVDIVGDLYLLDEDRRIVAVATPARTQDAAIRCADQLDSFPNALGACHYAVRKGWLNRAGSTGDCWRESDTVPTTVALLSPADQRTECRLLTRVHFPPTFRPDLVPPDPELRTSDGSSSVTARR